MALPSSGTISMKDVFNESYHNDYTVGDEPSSAQVGIGYGSLATHADWAENGQGGGGLAAWSTYNGDDNAPHDMDDFHSGNRGSGGGGHPKAP